MVRPDYKEFLHSAKGSTWEDHKYIKRVNGTYYYPDGYEGGRHLPDSEKSSESTKEEKTDELKEETSKLDLSETDVENLAKEVIRGNFGNGQERKDLLGENYAEIQKRVNEIMKSTSVGSKKVSEVSDGAFKKVEEIAKKVSSSTTSKVHSGVDLDQVLSVHKNKKDRG